MTLMQGIHLSHIENRASIANQGLLMRTPAVDGNYTDHRYTHYLSNQPRGVYFFPRSYDDSETRWLFADGCDGAWRIAYCGAMMHDPIVPQALVALDCVPTVDLIGGNF